MKRIAMLIGAVSCALMLAPQVSNARNAADKPVLTQYFTHSDAAPQYPDADGFIRRWTILEPIKNEVRSNSIFTDAYLSEAVSREYFKDQLEIVPADGQKVKVGKEKLVWHSLDTKNYYVNLLRFSEAFDKEYYGQIYWVVTTINCDRDLENVRMSAGANSAAMFWLNGEEALMLSNDRDLIMDDCLSERLTLKKGENIVRGAIFIGPGMADFCLRFVDENGNAVKNITVTSKLK